MSTWTTRPEDPADPRDAAAIREVLLAAWIPELSLAAATRRTTAQRLVTEALDAFRHTVPGPEALATAAPGPATSTERSGT